MINILQTYISQRFSAVLFFGLAVFIFLFSVPFDAMNALSLFDLFKVFFMIWSLRLYDDVMQWENDSIYVERVYTNESSRSKLILPLVISLAISVFICIGDGVDYLLAAGWLYFLILNHVMYKGLVHLKFWSFILPLLKYPVLFYYLTYLYLVKDEVGIFEWMTACALLLALSVYDLLSNFSEGRIPVYLYALVIVCMALLFFPNLNMVSFVVGIVVLVLSLILIHIRKEFVPVLWLFLILISKLILNNYVV